jgi:hypothetical protein
MAVIFCSILTIEKRCFYQTAWTNFSLQDEPWAEFSTLEVAACIILCTYSPGLQNNLT